MFLGTEFQWPATVQWFSLGTPVSSNNKTDCHDITEIVLKVALTTINLNQTYFWYWIPAYMYQVFQVLYIRFLIPECIVYEIPPSKVLYKRSFTPMCIVNKCTLFQNVSYIKFFEPKLLVRRFLSLKNLIYQRIVQVVSKFGIQSVMK
jgi:hypothetical protein